MRCLGEGRKERCTPPGKSAAALLGDWIAERAAGAEASLFVSRCGERFGRDAVERLVKHAATAACPSIAGKRVTPHVLRHGTAVSLLRGGVDRSIVALWLGHEQLDTTQIYLAADLAKKERALARTQPYEAAPSRYEPDDEALAFPGAL